MTQSYKTTQRKAILEFLAANGERHFTADEAFYALRESGAAIGRATVYRYFDKLTNEGVLRRYAAQNGGGACYEYCGAECSGHYHLSCRQCGELLHFDCDDVSKLYRHISQKHDFKIDPAMTVFLGVCGKCEEDREREDRK